MPVCFSQCKDMGVQSESVLQELAQGCSRQGTRTVGVFRPIDTGDMLEIYRAANH
jgi:hypothetical protein